MGIPRLKSYAGPAILSYGFRPFFLLGAVWSALSILLWLPQLNGWLTLSTAFAPVDWHVHEMLFGFLPAIVTGFLFTAVPNWTGRMPIQGLPLLALVLLWLAGRAAVTFSGVIGWLPAMLVDVAFLVAVAAVIGIEIVAGSNWRNLKTLAPVVVLALANAGFHIEAHGAGLSDYSRRAAILAILTLIILIGGRIIPSFTRNWLARENPGRLPAPFDRLDVAAIAVAVAALALWTVAPLSIATAGLMALAALVHLARLGRWAGDRALRDPLVAVLHLAYLFLPIGFGLAAFAALRPDLVTAAAPMHAFGAGAIGTMTLSVMVRASLGHTGRKLAAGRAELAIFIAIFLAALTRIAAAAWTGAPPWLIEASGLFWLLGFGGFALVFAPALLLPRKPSQ
jgi:uncharacterized protein involved in response to NO